MKTKKVKIFTEGGSGMGLGHISRCSALYDEIASRGLEVEFIIYGDTEKINVFEGRIVRNINWLSEDYLNNSVQNTDYCIVDSYLASRELYQIIAEKSKKSLYIDDNARIEYPKGIIVNPSINGDDLNYAKNNENTYLLGEKYIIVRKPFLNVERVSINQVVKEVLITMGGSDIRDLTPRILNDICIKYPGIKFNVVIGNTFHNVKVIESIDHKNIELHYNIDAELLQNLMLKSDFAITAAGQTMYELLATQTPFIPIQVIDNQSNNIKGLKKINPNQVVIEYDDERFVRKLEIEFSAFLDYDRREELINLYKKKVDGIGIKRMVDELLKERSDGK